MAELTEKGKRPVQMHPSSKLRNEIHPESTDDERDKRKYVAQEPDSDTVIPETPLARHRQLEREASLSPKARAVVECNVVKKKPRASNPSPVAFRLFTKESIGIGDRTFTPASSSFSYGPRKMPQKMKIPQVQTADVQAATLESSTLPNFLGHGEQQSSGK